MQQHAPTTDRQQAIAFLLERIDYERTSAVPYGQPDFRLDRMRDLLERLGSPHLKLPTIHIAGTKGKGSTAAMIAAMLTAAGLRTGLYSSPHLDRLEERLAIDGAACSEAQLVALVERIRPAVRALDAEAGEHGPRLTYFEVVTALAFLHYAQEEVDAVVLEVGLGGRLDSTNVCQPLVTVITSISFDHTRQLGSTLAAIAGEKAGIIKPGAPVVSGVTLSEPRQVIVDTAARHGSPLVERDVDFTFSYRAPRHVDLQAATGQIDFVYRQAGGELYKLPEVSLGLLGEHQGANAAVALAVAMQLRQLGWNLSEAALRTGLAEVKWPARVEVISRHPTVVLDAAHNVASVEALLRVLETSFDNSERWLLFATTQDKDVRGMLARVLDFFDHVVLTQYQSNPRGVKATELVALAKELRATNYSVAETPSVAWQEIRRQATPESLICIAGSFFIAAEVRAEIAAEGGERKEISGPTSR